MVQVNQTEVHYQETAYLNTIDVTDRNMWEVKIDIEDESVRFKVDTWSKGHGIVRFNMEIPQVLHTLKEHKSLCGPDQTSLKVIPEAELGLSYKEKSSNQNVLLSRT